MTRSKSSKRVALAVRDFALPSPRVGSIETNSGYGSASASSQELHALAQSARASEVRGYETEKRVSLSFARGGYEFVISGRIDGVFRDEGRVVVEEIKTAFDAPKLAARLRSELWHPYALQTLTYAYALERSGVDSPVPRLRIVSTRTMEGEDVVLDFDPPAYEAWVERRLDELVAEQKSREAIERRRRRAAEDLRFPFDAPREGQRELIAEIERGIADSKQLLLQAPTGLGKTAGVLYPLLKDALARGQQTIYVTPKNSQHDLATEAAARLQARGAKIKTLSISAKAKVCFKDAPVCDPDRCEFARDHYAKMAEHRVAEKAAKKKNLGARAIRALALKHEVCPFELSLEAVPKVDLVIGDYNYAFAPRNALARFTDPAWPRARRPNLAIDEAHALPSRACEHYSPELSERDLEANRERFRALRPPFAREGEALLDRALEILRALRTERGESARIAPEPEPFAKIDAAIAEYVGRYLATDAKIDAADPALRLRDAWSAFARALADALADPRFAIVAKADRRDGCSIKIVCSDASDALRPTYQLFANVAAFSATLKPFAYYGALSGLDGDSVRAAEFRSPFAAANRKVLVIPQVSTRYSARAANYGKIADGVARIVAVRPGNYAAFFPSFDFLEQVRTRLPDGMNVIAQTREGRSAQVRAALDRLREPNKQNLLMGVQGGVFAEGVDYPGDMLIGAIVVGPAIPAFGVEREVMREYYEARYQAGFAYAYAVPAMAKTIQAAGRAIRTETDRGIVVLMDDRFLEPGFAQAFPDDWGSSARDLVSNQILRDVEDFWKAPK